MRFVLVRFFTSLAVVLGVVFAATAGAVVPNQLDTFEDGTTQGWSAGIANQNPPVNVPTGGPEGADDSYMLLTSTGGIGSGSRLSVFNRDQWSGDYVAAQIDSVRMLVSNLGGTELHLRLRFSDAIGQIATNGAITPAIVVPAGSGWQRISFSIAPANLIALQGDPAAALAHTVEFRIFHSSNPAYPGEAIAAQLGVDNIEAVAHPTPADETSWGRIRQGFRRH